MVFVVTVNCREEIRQGNDSDNGACQVRLGSSESVEGSTEKDLGMRIVVVINTSRIMSLVSFGFLVTVSIHGYLLQQ